MALTVHTKFICVVCTNVFVCVCNGECWQNQLLLIELWQPLNNLEISKSVSVFVQYEMLCFISIFISGGSFLLFCGPSDVFFGFMFLRIHVTFLWAGTLCHSHPVSPTIWHDLLICLVTKLNELFQSDFLLGNYFSLYTRAGICSSWQFHWLRRFSVTITGGRRRMECCIP